MAPALRVETTAHYDRLARGLARQHSDFLAEPTRAVAILGDDPFNRTGKYPIRKLWAVKLGEGQHRLWLRRYRFRYDIFINRGVIVLYACGLRREDTYR